MIAFALAGVGSFMNYLLLQTFLLLLASYFLGAFLACLVKRTVTGARIAEPARMPISTAAEYPGPPPVTIAPPPVRSHLPPPVRPLTTPRHIAPVQPRIDVLRRPEPRPMPKLIDPRRFERALMGPEPNEGIPRKAIVEIRPKVLKSPTGPVRPHALAPVVEAKVTPPPPPIVDPPTVAAEDQTPSEPTTAAKVTVTATPAAKPDAAVSHRRSLSDATTAAAASAVAVAKAAAAASIGIFTRATSTDSKPVREQDKTEPATHLDTATDATAVDENPAVTPAGDAEPAVETKSAKSKSDKSEPVEIKACR